MEIYGDNLNEFYRRRQANPTDEQSKKALTARELLIEQFFLPFFVTYLRDLKIDAFTIMATPELAAILAEMKVGVTALGQYDLAKITKE